MSARLLKALTLVGCLVASAASAQAPAADEAPPFLATGTGLLVVDGREIPLPMAETQLGPLVSLHTLSGALGGGLTTGPLGQAHSLRLVGEEIVLGPDNPVMTVGREIFRLSQPPRVGAAGLYVPLDVVRSTYGRLLGWDVMWSDQDRRLYVMPTDRRDLDVDWNLVHLQGISTLVLTFPQPARYRIEEGRQQVVIELVGDRAVPRRPVVGIDDPLVRRVDFLDDRIVVAMAPHAVAEHYEQSRPFRLVFDVYQQRESQAEASPSPTRPATGVPTIVLDPGHGGSETGATGPSGVEEKELTLALARTLKRRLESRLPVRVVLTRTDDTDLPLDMRTAIANQHGAELFISLHLNSSHGRGANGAETYFLSLEASDESAAAIAELENRSATSSDRSAMGELELILWDLAQSEHLAESQRFARLVQQELDEALGLRDRGVKQAPFRVLMGAAMPAVLVELGFISNPDEEARLLQSSYQRELVDALVRAVERYRAQRSDRPALGGGP